MFFKMLLSDLKKNKGLNVILFLFIMVSFVLSVVGVLQVYIHTHGVSYTMEQCRSSELMAFYRLPESTKEKDIQEILNWAKNQNKIERYSVVEGINLYSEDIILVDSDVDVKNAFYNSVKVVMTQPMDMDLLYDTENKPFYVENGTIALPVSLKEQADLKIGDKIRLTTQLGYIYEFTISHFYKNPFDMGVKGFVLSQGDYEIFAGECPCKLTIYKCRLKNPDDINEFAANYPFENKDGFMFSFITNLATDLTYTISIMVSYFVVVINIFVILIMLLTIRFMLMASIKEEEKEIGMMRAIGVDSFRYRCLFIAKYIVFAFIGAFIGVGAGITISKYQVDIFCKNTILPTFRIRLLLSILAVLFMVIFIIAFTLLVMRRINRISVIDAIHGENRGQRFEKLSKYMLYRRKRISVPSYLAVSDLLNSIKKYIILIITYALGTMIVLSLFYLRSTLVSEEYFKNFLEVKSDFSISLPAETFDKYYQREGNYEGVITALNKELAEAGIRAEMKYDYISYGTILSDNKNDISCSLFFGDVSNSEISYRKGGTAPKLLNEAAISYRTAKLNNIKIGDKIALEYNVYGKNRTETHTVQNDFIITGFIDCMEAGLGTVVLMGDEFEDAERNDIRVLLREIYGTKKEKAQYIKQMKEMYGDDVALSGKERGFHNMEYVVKPLDNLKIIMTIVTLGIIILMTTLYSSVLMHSENNCVAMLKYMGFRKTDIRKWQLLRIGIITVIACVFGNILAQTVIGWLAAYVYDQNFACSGFTFTVNPLESYIIVPVLILTAVLGTMLVILKRINKIEIWEIRED